MHPSPCIYSTSNQKSNMEAQVVAQLDEFERTLDILIESISTNNPSIAAAEQLVAADDKVAQSLKDLAQHQTLHTRIQSLNAEAESLEQRIKDRFQVLVDCRKELTSIPSASVPADSRAVIADEVLRMGSRISKFTSPPTFRILPRGQPKPTDAVADLSNGASTPAPITPATQAPKSAKGMAADSFSSLPAESRSFLEEREKYLRDGWRVHPNDNLIRNGLLMDIQHIVDRGQDPANVGATTRDANAKRQADEAEAPTKNAKEESEHRERVKPQAQERPAPAQPVQAHDDPGFDLFDPEED